MGLGGHASRMPSFRPWESITRDVVREAIIPLSRHSDGSGGVALATVWNKGERVRAESMVTHAWSNVFTYIVAAIVADALERDCYDEEAELLANGRIEELKDMLRQKNVLQRVYWVCALCINQHSAICGGYAPEPEQKGTKDHDAWLESQLNTTTGKPYPLCDCKEEKIFNNKPATCELNKFDDMMRLLAALAEPKDGLPGQNVREFTQVVAMDKHFVLLSRVWCLAEIVEAEKSEILQNVKIYDGECVDEEYHKLKHLDIRDCEASRPEDKQEILGKIGNIDVFCENMRELIMGESGLLSRFADREDAVKNAARIARRSAEERAAEDAAAQAAGHAEEHAAGPEAV